MGGLNCWLWQLLSLLQVGRLEKKVNSAITNSILRGFLKLQSFFKPKEKEGFLNQKSFIEVKEGDYVSLTHVGAYGMSLSSNYNLRPTVAEIMVNGSNHKLIRKRQSLESLIKN